jgi:hypothetical protein
VSLLDEPPETVLVYPEIVSTDDYGNTVRVPAATPVTVAAHVQPLVGQENTAQGQEVEARYRLSARDAPLSAWAEVEWDGARYDVVDQPREFTWPPEMAHIIATIRRR